MAIVYHVQMLGPGKTKREKTYRVEARNEREARRSAVKAHPVFTIIKIKPVYTKA